MSDTDLLAPGTDLGGIVIERLLGRGGMGTVYLAKQRALDRQVAVKVMRSGFAEAAARDAFLVEARAAAALRHPQLASIHALGSDAARGLVFTVMEYVPGTPAGRMVKAQGAQSRERALQIARQIAEGLGEAHRHGFVHRDVKPDNIIVSDDGRAKLLDLGLARDRLAAHRPESQGSDGQNASGPDRLRIVGTPLFSAPEQHRDPDAATPESDVFSLAATLCVLLTASPPWSGISTIDLIVRMATTPPELPPSLTGDLRSLLARWLSLDPEQRPSDGDAAAEEIAALLSGRSTVRPLAPRRPLRRLRRR